MKKFSVKQIALTGVMAALVFAASQISIQIPTAIDGTRIHFGNVLCILSGLLLGGTLGGCAAGIGSMFFDVLNPLYISSAPFTLVFKFFIGFISGKVAYSGGANGLSMRRNIVGAVGGSLAYIILYLSRAYITARFVKLLAHETALLDIGTKAITSTVNGVIACIVAVPLAAAIRAAGKQLTINK